MRRILVLDDQRTFQSGRRRRFVHVQTNAAAVEELRYHRYDELWLDYDLAATDRLVTSETLARAIASGAVGTDLRTIRLITDLEYGRTRLQTILCDRAVATEIGQRWNTRTLDI